MKKISERRNKACTKSRKRSNDNDTASNAKRYCVDDDDDSELSDEGSVAPAELLRSTRRCNSIKDGTVKTADGDDGNQCCVCFRTYEEDQIKETGFLWVQYVCGKWVHEDCYSKVVMDKHARELICPYCAL